MILAVDIGNTSVGLGVGSSGTVEFAMRCDNTAASAMAAMDELKSKYDLTAVAVASVVPAANRIWRAAIADEFGLTPLFIRHDLKLGVSIDYPDPASIGADRLANASAALQMFGAPVVVADFGTALTFDIVSESGAYVGGIIAPGLRLMLDYLAERTALLPEIEFRRVDSIVGKSTEEAILIGARSGYQGLVGSILGDLKTELGDYAFCATGGYAGVVLDGMQHEFTIVPELTLLGIINICQLNI